MSVDERAHVASAVLGESGAIDPSTPTVRGYDFNNGVNYEQLLNSYLRSGFQVIFTDFP
jgi:deoxyhypusine synthase